MKNLTQFLEKLVKDDGFVLEDANKKQHIICLLYTSDAADE